VIFQRTLTLLLVYADMYVRYSNVISLVESKFDLSMEVGSVKKYILYSERELTIPLISILKAVRIRMIRCSIVNQEIKLIR
jgi:hypothetical protein